MFEDKTLVCRDCGKEFVWTAGEQEFYASRGFENQPQRCKACRDARKNAVRGERQMFDAVCAACGKACKVPFQPREDRPVYCSECFAKIFQKIAALIDQNPRHPGTKIPILFQFREFFPAGQDRIRNGVRRILVMTENRPGRFIHMLHLRLHQLCESVRVPLLRSVH